MRRAELYQQRERVRAADSGVMGEIHGSDVGVRHAIDGMTAAFVSLSLVMTMYIREEPLRIIHALPASLVHVNVSAAMN